MRGCFLASSSINTYWTSIKSLQSFIYKFATQKTRKRLNSFSGKTWPKWMWGYMNFLFISFCVNMHFSHGWNGTIFSLGVLPQNLPKIFCKVWYMVSNNIQSLGGFEFQNSTGSKGLGKGFWTCTWLGWWWRMAGEELGEMQRYLGSGHCSHNTVWHIL